MLAAGSSFDWTIFTAETNSAGHAPTKEGLLARESAALDSSSQAVVAQLSFCSPGGLHDQKAGLTSIQDLPVHGSATEQADQVEALCREIMQERRVPICLGGDHLIKFGCLSAAKSQPDRLGILYLDAHPDTMMVEEKRYDSVVHHALRDDALDPKKFLIIGLRQFNAAELSGLRTYSPSIITGRDFAEHSIDFIRERVEDALSGCDRLYVSIDPDGLNPAEVRAVEQPFPGGPTTDQFLLLVEQALSTRKLAGLDISEHVPRLDHDCLTALCLAQILNGIMSFVDERPRRRRHEMTSDAPAAARQR